MVAAAVTQDNNDVGQLEPLITQAQDNLEASGTMDSIGTVVADAGYFSDDNARLELGVELLIAPTKSEDLDDALAARTRPSPVDDWLQRRFAAELALAQWRARRHDIMAAYIEGHVTRTEAAQVLGISIHSFDWLRWHHRKFDWLPKAQLPPEPPRPSAKQVMLERFAQPGARQTYATRATTVEPVFGQIKELRGVRRFQPARPRGLPDRV